MLALPPADEPSAPGRARVDDPEMLAAALAADEAALVLLRRPDFPFTDGLVHGYLLLRSACV